MNHLSFKRVVLGCLWLFLMSCQNDDEQAVSLDVKSSSSLIGTLWNLQYIQRVGGEPQIPPGEFKESLFIYFESDSTFRAGSPCNAGFGRYEDDQKGNFNVRTLGSTYKLCADKNMVWENKFFEGLRAAKRYVVDGAKLKISGKNELVFQQEVSM